MDIETKTCTKCKVIKRPTEFRKDPKYKSGLCAMCIECCREREREYERLNQEARVEKHRKWREENREEINSRNRDRWNNDPEWKAKKDKYKGMYKEWRAAYASDYKKANRDKINCREQLRYWVDKGTIVRPECCELCGKSEIRIEAHHSDYTKPLSVDWLCQKCHLKLEHFIRKDSRVQPDRLTKKTSKEDVIVKPSEETTRGISEEGTPPTVTVGQ